MALDSERNPEAPAPDSGVSIEEARASLGTLVIDASVANKRRVITRHGKRAAAIIGLRDLDRLESLDAAAAVVAANE